MIPSSAEISRMAIESVRNDMLELGPPKAPSMKLLGKHKFDLEMQESLERHEIQINNQQNSSNFVFSKAKTIDNRPEYA